MKIPAFDYLRQLESLKEEFGRAFDRVLCSGQLILGPEVRAFEQEFSEFLGAGVETVGVANGTDALALILRCLGVGPGDEVVTVANTAVPTVAAIRYLGATPVFCDVEAETGLMDPKLLEARLTPRTRAVIPVHLFGNVADIPAILEVIGARRIAVIEDCAQAHGARLGTRAVGTMGLAGAFSFYPTKNLGALGDGGACVTRQPELAEELRRARMYGFQTPGVASSEGVNSRLDELQAALLRVKLRHLEDWVERRRNLAQLYRANLPEVVRGFISPPGTNPAVHLFPVLVDERDRVRRTLAEEGIDTGIHYPMPIHLMPGYDFLGLKAGALPITEALAPRLLSLPMFPELTEAEVLSVCEALLRAI